MELRYIPLTQLEVSASNVRRRDISADVDELAHSMERDGLQQPIVVQGKDGRFEIIIGQRRYLAAKQLGWQELPAYVKPERLSSLDAKVISFAENVQRRDLAPRDKADTCVYLRGELGSIEAVAERLGITPQTVRKWIGYAAVPETLKTMVDDKKITASVAMRLAEFVPDERKAVEIAKRIAETNPPAKQRERVLAAMEEAPGRPIDAMFRRAEEMKRERQITFVLPERYALAMERAERNTKTSAAEIARDATIDWLLRSRY